MMRLIPPNPSNLGPRRLKSAVRAMRVSLRDRGLGPGSGAEVEGVDLQRRTATLRRKASGGELTAKDRRKIPSVVPWMFEKNQRQQAAELIRASLGPSGTVSPRLWWTLCCWFPDGKGFPPLDSMRPAVTKRWARRQPFVAGLSTTNRLSSVVANEFRGRDVTLVDGLEQFNLPFGSPLCDGVMNALTNVPADAWLEKHATACLSALSSMAPGSVWVGRVGRALLEPAYTTGATPADVAGGTQLGDLIAGLLPALPKNTSAAAWNALGDGAREMIRWWKTQRDLERFFSKWNAETEREEFWRRYVRQIADIEGFEEAGALAVRLGDVWYVEVGWTGFATYAYRASGWERAARSFRRATTPEVIRAYHRDRVDKAVHRGTWQPKFIEWVRGLSGVGPDSERVSRGGRGSRARHAASQRPRVSASRTSRAQAGGGVSGSHPAARSAHTAESFWLELIAASPGRMRRVEALTVGEEVQFFDAHGGRMEVRNGNGEVLGIAPHPLAKRVREGRGRPAGVVREVRLRTERNKKPSCSVSFGTTAATATSQRQKSRAAAATGRTVSPTGAVFSERFWVESIAAGQGRSARVEALGTGDSVFLLPSMPGNRAELTDGSGGSLGMVPQHYSRIVRQIQAAGGAVVGLVSEVRRKRGGGARSLEVEIYGGQGAPAAELGRGRAASSPPPPRVLSFPVNTTLGGYQNSAVRSARVLQLSAGTKVKLSHSDFKVLVHTLEDKWLGYLEGEEAEYVRAQMAGGVELKAVISQLRTDRRQAIQGCHLIVSLVHSTPPAQRLAPAPSKREAGSRKGWDRIRAKGMTIVNPDGTSRQTLIPMLSEGDVLKAVPHRVASSGVRRVRLLNAAGAEVGHLSGTKGDAIASKILRGAKPTVEVAEVLPPDSSRLWKLVVYVQM